MRVQALAAVATVLAATALLASPSSAQPGYATSFLEIKAGPDRGYPTVGAARRGAKIVINGCLTNWTWCDVTANRDRGWVRGDSIQSVDGGRRIPYGASWRVPTYAFNFGPYWDDHYKSRSFYKERDKWDRGHGRNDRRNR